MYGGQNTAPSGPPKVNSLSNAISDLDPCLDRAAKYADALKDLCDRIVGPTPEKPQAALGGGEINPLIGRIHERRSRLVEILDRIEQSLQTLNGAV